MDSLNKKAVVRQIVETLASETQGRGDPKGVIRVLDDIGGHYLLFNDTWKDGRRYYGCFLHIDIDPNGKIWLQHDGTDQKIAEALLAAGLGKEDIVLAFQPPAVRSHTGFAVA